MSLILSGFDVLLKKKWKDTLRLCEIIVINVYESDTVGTTVR